jgi:hypothetical protein
VSEAKVTVKLKYHETFAGVGSTRKWSYRVDRVTNTTEVQVRQELSKAEVDALIAKGWTVQIDG